MDNQDCSTSKQQEADKIEDGTEKKKLKTELLQPANQSDVEVHGECLINQLPPEMLMEILKYLDSKSLLSAKLMNRKLNGVSREILKSREDVETVIKFYWCWNKAGRGYVPQTGSASLENFLEFFGNSKEAPLYYTRFRLNDLKASVFNDADWIKFISDFWENMKSLRLVFKTWLIDLEEEELDEKLRDLIWNQLPNLQEFGLACYYYLDRIPFPTILKGTTTTTVQLPNLKILHLDHSSCKKLTSFVTDLLEAAVNLEKIELSDHTYEFYKNFWFLQSLGKLHLVQNATIKPDAAFILRFESVPLDFKLKKLELRVEFLNKFVYLQPLSTCLSHLFESTKDTLTELTTDPLGFLPGLQFPKFSKLTNLQFDQFNGFKINAFPIGTNLKEVFPALQCLDFQVPWTELFPHDQPFSFFPSLKTLKITGQEMTKVVIARISFLCPKLKKFVISGGRSGSLKKFPEVGNAIWFYMKQLEELTMDIDLDTKENTFPAVDSCFTGFSAEDCNCLYTLIQAQKLVGKWSVQVNISELEVEADRKCVSILDLKDLKSLTLNLFSRAWNAVPKPDSDLFKETLSVSEKYGFQLMDKLTVNKNHN